jgi:hypothetical protein
MAKIIFECETELNGDERIEAVQLMIKRQGKEKWDQGLLFSFGRPQKPRNGKHLKIGATYGIVHKLGETDKPPPIDDGDMDTYNLSKEYPCPFGCDGMMAWKSDLMDISGWFECYKCHNSETGAARLRRDGK